MSQGIDNGRQRRLVVSGVFDGVAGESNGALAFIPNRAGKRPQDARGGLLDGEPVLLTLVTAPGPKSPFCVVRYRVLDERGTA
jgi:hypothetical protein